MQITSLGHAAITVRDLHASEAFYSGLLGMPVVARCAEEHEVGFRVGEAGHFMIKAIGADAPAPDTPTLGIHHLAFIVGNTPQKLAAAARCLTERDVRYQMVAHGEYESLYLHDPDGRLIELYYWPEW